MNTAVSSQELKLIRGDHLDGTIYSGGWKRTTQAADIIEPATGSVLGRIGMASPADVAQASETAAKAQKDWAAASYDTRAAVIRKAAGMLELHFSDVVEWLIRESGSARGKAEFETQLSIKALNEAAALASQPQGLVLPSEAGRMNLARRRPLGVVGVISPFNFPLYLAMRAVAPALAVGNAVVLKPDPRTAVCGGLVFATLFEKAGLPEGLIHVLPGAGDAGAALVADPNIAMIQFTGSTKAGRIVGENASRHLKKVSLELGGKNTLVILKDADLELAVKNAAWGAWLHQGQICMSSGRILVEAPILEAFTEALARKAKSLPVGNPATDNVALGPIINKAQLDHIDRVVKTTVDQGARLMAGGSYDKLFYSAVRARRCQAWHGCLRGGDLWPGRLHHLLQRRRRGGGTRQPHRIRSVRGSDLAQHRPRHGHRRQAARRPAAHQRPDGQRRGDQPVRRRRCVGQRHQHRRSQQHRRVHPVAVADHPQHAAGLSVLNQRRDGRGRSSAPSIP